MQLQKYDSTVCFARKIESGCAPGIFWLVSLAKQLAFSFLFAVLLVLGATGARAQTWTQQPMGPASGTPSTTWPQRSDFGQGCVWDYWQQKPLCLFVDNENQIYGNSIWLYNDQTNTFTWVYANGTSSSTSGCVPDNGSTGLFNSRHPYHQVAYNWRVSGRFTFAFGACGGGGGGGVPADVWDYPTGIPTMPSGGILRLNSLSSPVSTQYNGTATYDPVRNAYTAFGGLNNGGLCCRNDTQIFTENPATYAILSTTNNPAARAESGLVYDWFNQRVLLWSGFSSYTSCENSPTRDLWALPSNSTAWLQLSPSGPLPPAHTYWAGRVVYDTKRNWVWFYDNTGSMYYLDVTTNTFHSVSTTGGPALSSDDGGSSCGTGDDGNSLSMVYDPVNDMLVIFNAANPGIQPYTMPLSSAFPVNPPACGSGYSTSSTALLLPYPLAYPTSTFTQYRDPLGACVERISTVSGFGNGDNPVPIYSQNQAWNADNSKILFANGVVINASTGATICTNVNSLIGEPVWSATDGNTIWGLSSNSILKYSVSTCTASTEHTFSEYTSIDDGGTCPGSARKVGWHDQDKKGQYRVHVGCTSGGTQEVFWWDVINHVKSSNVTNGKPTTGNCSLSTGASDTMIDYNGQYVLIGWGTAGTDNTSTPTCGWQLYDLNFNVIGQVWYGHDHTDIGLDASGNEFLVSLSNGTAPGFGLGPTKCSISASPGFKNGTCSTILPVTTALGHISCHDYTNAAASHYCVLSFDQSTTNSTVYGAWEPFMDEIVQFNLSGTILGRLAHTYTDPQWAETQSNCTLGEAFSYWMQAHPTIRQDGQQVLYGSSWGPGCRAEAYLLNLNSSPSNTVNLSPPNLSFGNQAQGTSSSPQAVALINGTSSAISFTGAGISITGNNASDFTETNNCGSSVVAGGACTINVTFKPSMSASETAFLSVADSGPNSPQTASLTGTGFTPAPGISFSPSGLSFGNQTVGTTSVAKSVTLTNSGTASLSITGISVTGTNKADFATTNNCGSSVSAGSNCSINVTFTPSTVAVENASLSVADNASGSPQTAALSGTGTAAGAPSVSFSPASLSFGNQTVGTSVQKSTTLTNTGGAALSVTSITISGTNQVDFTVTNTCGSAVAAGSNCSINVTFKPSTTSAEGASISVADNASGSPQAVALSGTGVSAGSPPTVGAAATAAIDGNTQFAIDVQDLGSAVAACSACSFKSASDMVGGQTTQVQLRSGASSPTANVITLKQGSVDGAVTSVGSSQFVIQTTDGSPWPATITVLTSSITEYINFSSTPATVQTGQSVSVRGLLFKSGPTGVATIVARRIKAE